LAGKVRERLSAKGPWAGSGKYLMQESADLRVKDDKYAVGGQPVG